MALAKFAILANAIALAAAGEAAVATYHYDNNRTGWNQHETVLTPVAVSGSSFGPLKTVDLDDQVDAQPLVAPQVRITAGKRQGVHDVVYVATESNSIYAIDTHSAEILLSANFGPPVSRPLGCRNNGPNVGVTSTPVAYAPANTLYVMTYTQDSGGPAYHLHALDMGSLKDKTPPQLVTASHTLTDGSVFAFHAAYQRQRPALLLANDSIYAGFGSFCDLEPGASRGWLLGWAADTLAPLSSNQILDDQSMSPGHFFLSSIWMSGYGPAADDAGNVLFVTGNSDPAGSSYDGATDIQESVVKITPGLTSVLDLFTPSDQPQLDAQDRDFGAGGVMVLPDQPGAHPHLAVAAGKEGTLFLLDEDHLGGFSAKNSVLGSYSIGPCWCGPSYFVDPSDGAARVVSSGGRQVMVWKVETSPKTSLRKVAQSANLGGLQDPGFLTSVSSGGKENPIIWALSRPEDVTTSTVYLYAFEAKSGSNSLKLLFKGAAGVWPYHSANANLIPVVANGEVFVATYKRLSIFGLASDRDQ